MRALLLASIAAFGLSACDDVGSSSGGSPNRVMDIINDTNSTIMRFYASNSGENLWGPDQLGSEVIGPNQFLRMDFDDGTGACVFDFKAEMSTGQVLRRDNINVCVETNWRIF